MRRRLTSEKKQAALGNLESLAITESRRRKIRNIIEYSSFRGAYVDYFLSENPVEFRNLMPHNRRFAKDALQYGIDPDTLSIGVHDEGIELIIGNGVTGYFNPRLVNYANELCKHLAIIYSEIRENVIPREGFFIPSGNRISIRERDIIIFEDVKEKYFTDEVIQILSYIVGVPFQQLEMDRATLYAIRGYEYTEKYPSVTSEQMRDLVQRLNHAFERTCFDYVDEVLGRQLGKFYGLFRTYLQNGRIAQQDFVNIVSGDSPTSRNSEGKNILETVCEGVEELLSMYNAGEFNVEKSSSGLFSLRARRAASEIKSELTGHIDGLNPTVSSKLRNRQSVRYTLKVEKLYPEDVTFGNDGGCCIQVNDYNGKKDSDPGCQNVPFYMLDNATIVLGIYQQLGNKHPTRVGMILGFATIDTENNPVLLCNSVELSDAMNPLGEDGLNTLMKHTVGYLSKFAQAAGFKRIAMGNHNYNTARNYLPEDRFEKPNYRREELMKLPDTKPIPFYSEVLYHDFSIEETWAWLKVG